ncbi:MAG: hypothetical protein ACW99Q_18070, partial [Candidatus Kariarchaeaceae archaeon]
MNSITVDLRSWTVIKISGPDKKEYLNGIITFDLDGLDNKICQSMFLTPKAKIRSIFWLIEINDEYIIYVPPTMKIPLVEDLLKYKLNMNVKLEDITDETPDLYLVQTNDINDSSTQFGDGKFKFEQTDTKSGDIMSYNDFNNWLLVNQGAPV